MMEKKITFDRFARWVISAFGVVLLIMVVNYLHDVLLPFFVAVLLAYLLYPLVSFVQNKLRVRNRALSIVITLLIVGLLLAGLVMLIVPPIIEQFNNVKAVATDYLHKTAHVDSFTYTITEWMHNNRIQIEEYIRSKEFTSTAKEVAPQLFNFLGKATSVVISILASFATLLYTFFILLDYEELGEGFIKIFPKKNRPFARALMHDVKREVNNYVRGQGLVAFIMGLLFCIGLSIIGFPMAIAIGIFIGICDIIPYMHFLGLIPIVILSLLEAASTGESVWMVLLPPLIVFLIVQMINDFILHPKILSMAMSLNPAVLLLALSVWGYLLGFIGLIIALPLTTLIIAYYKRYVTREENDGETTES